MSQWKWAKQRADQWEYDFDTDTHWNAPIWFNDPKVCQHYEDTLKAQLYAEAYAWLDEHLEEV